MKNILEENLTNKENNHPNDLNLKFPNIISSENLNSFHQKLSFEKDSQEKKDNAFSQLKLKIVEHYEIKSKENQTEKISTLKNQFEEDKNIFINDFYSEESENNLPKIIEGKEAVSINEIIGEESKQPVVLEMLDDEGIPLSPGKISAKSFGVITSYAANTNQGIVRDYNEDRVSVIINMNKPKYYTSTEPWPKISYFGVFDGHAGNKCAEFLRDNLLNYICNNNYFPNDVPNAIKYGFKKIDEDYLYNYAFINNQLIDNSGSCGLILLIINNLIYIANVGDSRCVGSFKNGKIQKDITLDHKPNTPYEKERIVKNGGKIYQTQTPLEDDESFRDKILMGPYRVFPGKLSVSRTVGDAEGKIEELGGNPNVIVPIPDIFCFDLEKDDIDFFILGCDGIYDQLYTKDIFKCFWLILNNNLEVFKKRIFENNIENNFKGNYGNEINMHTTSGNIVDLILKASMFRKSFDNVTCLFISFKNFFENLEKSLQKKNLDENININLNDEEDEKNKQTNKVEILLKNKSNIENQYTNKVEQENIFKDKNFSEKTLTKEYNNNIMDNKLLNNNDDDENKNLNSFNEAKRIKGSNTLNIKKIRINSVPKKPLSTLNKKKIGEEKIINLSNNQNNNRNITDNNILTYNKNVILKSEKNDNKERAFSFNDRKNINSNLYSPVNKDNIKKINNNNLMNSSNQMFFTKMHITGINFKNKNKKEPKNNYQIIKNNMINDEDNYKHTSYNKRISPLFSDNINDNGKSPEIPKKEKYFISIGNNINNKKINYKKINETEYMNNYGNNDSKNGTFTNNIRSNSHTNNDINKYNIKPLVLKNDKYQQANINYNFHQNNLNIKFNNIIKTNAFGLAYSKKTSPNKIADNNLISLKNITLTRLKKEKKNDEIRIKKPMPTLTGHLHATKNNKFNEDNFGRQRRFITNDNVKRKINLSEHRKLPNGSYKIELNVSNKNNNTGISNKVINLYNKNVNGDFNANIMKNDLTKNGVK